MYLIREALVKDCDDLKRLYKIVSPNAKFKVLPERIKALLKDKNNYLLVAEYEGKVVGTMSLGICLNGAFGSSKYGVIENIAVDVEFRRQGIGKMLLQEVERICRKAGCGKIMCLSGTNRLAAHALLRNGGFNDQICKAFKKYLK